MGSVLSSVGSIVGGIFGGPVGASVGGLAGSLLGGSGGSNSGARGATGSAAGANNAANQLYGGVNNNISALDNLAQLALQRYQSAAPQEQQALDYFFQRATGGTWSPGAAFTGSAPTTPSAAAAGANQGYGPPKTGAPLGTIPGVNGGQPVALWGSRKTAPGVQITQPAGTPISNTGGSSTNNPVGGVNGALGIYDSPEYRLLRQAAEQQVGQNAINLGRDYSQSLAGRGLQNSSLMTGGQSNIIANAGKNYSDFTRQLAMNAADKQDQLMQQALNAAQPALGALNTSASINQGAGGLGSNLMGALMGQSNTLNQAQGTALQGQGFAGIPFGTTGINGGVQFSNPGANYATSDTSGPAQSAGADYSAADYNAQYDNPGAAAHGGMVHAGLPLLVGEGGGPETMVPAKPRAGLSSSKEGTVNIPQSMFLQWLQHTMGEVQNMPHRQGGGSTANNGAYMVGEHGPELFVPRTDGYIIPHSMKDYRSGAGQADSLYSAVHTNQPEIDPLFQQIYHMHGGR